jgi:hypothetical protein
VLWAKIYAYIFSSRKRFLFSPKCRYCLWGLPSFQWILGVKQAGPEADSLPPSSDGLNSGWDYTSTVPHVFMVRAGITVLNLMNLDYVACVCARACVRSCMCVCVCARAYVCMYVCMFIIEKQADILNMKLLCTVTVNLGHVWILYEVCPKRIQPYLISREPVAWP